MGMQWQLVTVASDLARLLEAWSRFIAAVKELDPVAAVTVAPCDLGLAVSVCLTDRAGTIERIQNAGRWLKASFEPVLVDVQTRQHTEAA